MATIDEVVAICEDTTIQKQHEAENVEMDGLVIKVNDVSLRTDI